MSSIDLTVAGTTTIALTQDSPAIALTQTENAIALSTAGIVLAATLTAIAGLNVTDGNFIVGDGTTWVVESGNTTRTSLGLGTGDSPTFTNLTLGNSAVISYGTGNITISLTGATGRFYATIAGGNSLVSTFVNRNTNVGSGAGTGFLFAAGASATGFIGGIGVSRIDASQNSRLVFRILAGASLSPPTTSAPLYLEGSGTGDKAVFNAYVNIIGGENTQQLIVKAHSTQTNNVVETQKSDGTISTSINNAGQLKMLESASASADVAGYGQLWIKTATPCELWFTDDAGNDHQVDFV